MPDYQLTDSTIVIRLADGASIPDDPANSDRQRYLQWLDAGGVPLPPEPPAPIASPASVTMRQARLELLSRELLDDVEAVITSAGRAAQIEWEYAATVDRSHPIIAVVQQQQGMTDSQIDDLFREAAKL